jgi:hypothetical protein
MSRDFPVVVRARAVLLFIRSFIGYGDRLRNVTVVKLVLLVERVVVGRIDDSCLY